MTESRTPNAALSGGRAPDALPAERSNGENATARTEADMDRLLRSDLEAYRTRDERAAMRAALGDATALCEVIADQIADENRGRGGRGAITKHGRALLLIASRCADAIWMMRDKVDVPACRDTESRQPEPHPNTAAETVATGDGGESNDA